MRIVFFGDSLTAGAEGAAYLRVLRERAAADAWLRDVELINAGVGGDTAEHLLARVRRDVVAQQPDAVLVFAGANDCTTLLLRRRLPTPRTLRSRYYFFRRKGVRGIITPERYATALRAIIAAIRASTGARVALCTPTTIGEVPGSRDWRTLDHYAAATRTVAAECDVALLDLRAAFVRALDGFSPAPAGDGSQRRASDWWARALRSLGVQARASAQSPRLTCDGVHLTARGAELVADLIWPWLLGVALNGASAGHESERPGEAP
jgi:lysophospholipase L1-like esterase